MAIITQRTTMVKKEEASADWYVLDVDNLVVGRVATQIATVLMGKHKPEYTPHVDCGDVVVVVNVERVRFTGAPGKNPNHPYYTAKFDQRTYARYSGYPGGLKTFTATEMFVRHPEMVLQEAVRRMLPKSTLGRHMLKKLRLFVGPEHSHQAQQPKPFPEYLLGGK